MKNKNFYKNHFKKVSEIFSKIDLVQLEKISNLFLKTNKSKKKLLFVVTVEVLLQHLMLQST